MDEEENPFDKDWESFPPEELADHCGISDLFYWRRYDEDPEASPQVENPWAKLGPERKVRPSVRIFVCLPVCDPFPSTVRSTLTVLHPPTSLPST